MEREKILLFSKKQQEREIQEGDKDKTAKIGGI
jgi:hypothetical protein